MVSMPIMARVGWRERETGREDAIDEEGRRGGGAAAFPLPSCFLGGRYFPPLPGVEKIGLRESLDN